MKGGYFALLTFYNTFTLPFTSMNLKYSYILFFFCFCIFFFKPNKLNEDDLSQTSH